MSLPIGIITSVINGNANFNVLEDATFSASGFLLETSEITGTATAQIEYSFDVQAEDAAKIAGSDSTFSVLINPTKDTSFQIKYLDINDNVVFSTTPQVVLTGEQKRLSFTIKNTPVAVKEGLTIALVAEISNPDGNTVRMAEFKLEKGDSATSYVPHHKEVERLLLGLYQAAIDDLTSSFNNAVTVLQSQVNGKANTSHTHNISDVTGLQVALDSKASNSHTHAISEVVNLQQSLDSKANASHTHSISDVVDLQLALDGKADSSHAHNYGINDITGLQNALDSKADSFHVHSWTNINNKPTTYPPSAHTHTISEVINLQNELDGKANKNGDASEQFLAATGASNNAVVNLQQLNARLFH